jgi:hypothetical protein
LAAISGAAKAAGTVAKAAKPVAGKALKPLAKLFKKPKTRSGVRAKRAGNLAAKHRERVAKTEPLGNKIKKGIKSFISLVGVWVIGLGTLTFLWDDIMARLFPGEKKRIDRAKKNRKVQAQKYRAARAEYEAVKKVKK